MGSIDGLERSPDTSLERRKLPEWVRAFMMMIEVRGGSIPSSVVFHRKNLLFGSPCKPIESPLSSPLPLRSKGRIFSPGHTLTWSKASPCHALECLAMPWNALPCLGMPCHASGKAWHSKAWGKPGDGVSSFSGSRIRTYDLKIMSLASYQAALSRISALPLSKALPPGEFESPFPP